MHIELTKYQLELQHTFSISRESHDVQDTLIVALSTDDGHTGYGEATANPYYNISVVSMIEEINAVRSILEGYPLEAPEVFHGRLVALGLSNFAICALDMAYHDLDGRIQKQPLYKIWGQHMNVYPKTNYTIGIATIEKMVQKIEEKPWPIYKIKLGTDHDVAIVKQLRAVTDAVFRVDANCAWSETETIDNAYALKELGVEFIEQPLKADNWQGMKKVMTESVLPIIADESCIVEADVEKCHQYFNGINIKLTKCGGLSPARRMIEKAKSLGLEVMVGCMTESNVGIAAIAQLLPQLDYVDMDGAMLLKSPIAHGVKILEDATIQLPKLPGTGVTLI